MDLNVNIDAEDINKQITQAVAASAIGAKLQEVIKEAVDNLTGSYNNPLKPVVNDFIANLAHQIIRDQYTDRIKEVLIGLIEEKLTKEFIGTVWEAFEKKINNY